MDAKASFPFTAHRPLPFGCRDFGWLTAQFPLQVQKFHGSGAFGAFGSGAFGLLRSVRLVVARSVRLVRSVRFGSGAFVCGSGAFGAFGEEICGSDLLQRRAPTIPDNNENNSN